MKMQAKKLWKVPVYCAVSSWISFYATVYLGRFFFVAQEMGSDGVIHVSADPIRSAIFNGVLFLVVLFVGGFWAFRNMTKKEILVSSAIASVVYLLIVLCQLMTKVFPVSLFFNSIQNWISVPSSLIYALTDNLAFSAIISSFSRLLFILFGERKQKNSKQ